jgi:Ca-activated chloride channel family protein
MKSTLIQSFKRAVSRTLKVLTLGALGLTGTSYAAGLMTPAGGLPELEIKSHDVLVTIEDGYSVTQVDQVFSNPHGQDLEATYHFPVPARAAVSEFTVWIDGKPVIGEVLEKQHAQTIYQAEKAAGRETGIATKTKHYNFEIKVSPVRAAQDTRIRLVYLQAATIDTGIGRYVYPLEDGGTDDQATDFWTANNKVRESFSFTMKLRSGYPVSGLRIPAHPQATITQVNGSDQEWLVNLHNNRAAAAAGAANGLTLNGDDSYKDASVADLTDRNSAGTSEFDNSYIKSRDFNSTDFKNKDHDNTLNTVTLPSGTDTHAASLDKDIVVYWRLADNLPGSIDLVTHKAEHADRGTFMLTVTPGDDLGKITEGRDWVFVLDKSGSMQSKYHTLTDGVQRALSNLKIDDRFRLITFNNQAQELTTNWVYATQENIRFWSGKLMTTHPDGGTNLYVALDTALKTLDADRTSGLILVTDGEANVGVTEKKSFLNLMQQRDVRLYTTVMGNGSNRTLLESMTEVSNGFSVNVSNSDDIVGKLIEFTSKVSHEALHDVKLDIDGVDITDLTPAVTTSLYRGEQLVVFGHYRGNSEATVTLSGKVSGEEKLYQTRFVFTDSTANPEIERLWAYAKIRDLQNMQAYLGKTDRNNNEYKNAIVDIAIGNSLVTNYTSMVVMRDEQFEARGIERKNRDRRQQETKAAAKRAAAPVTSKRADTRQPAFKQNRSSYSGSGGGSASIEWLGLLFAALVLAAYRSRQNRRSGNR